MADGTVQAEVMRMTRLWFVKGKHVVEAPSISSIPLVRGLVGDALEGAYAYGNQVSVEAALPGKWWRDAARLLATFVARHTGGLALDVRGEVGVVVNPAVAPIVHDIFLAAARLHVEAHNGLPLTSVYYDIIATLPSLHYSDWDVVVRRAIRVRPGSRVWELDWGRGSAWGYSRIPSTEKQELLVGLRWGDIYEEALIRAPRSWDLEPARGGVVVEEATDLRTKINGLFNEEGDTEPVEV